MCACVSLLNRMKVQWRVVYYVVGSLDNYLLLMDQFWNHLAEQMAQETKIEVCIHTAPNVNVDEIWENMTYSGLQLNEPSERSSDLPMTLFEAPPCFGKKPVAMSVEIHDAETVSLVFVNTYVYKDRLDALGISGGRINVTDNSKGDYVRFLKNVIVTKDEAKVEEVFKAMKNIASGTQYI